MWIISFCHLSIYSKHYATQQYNDTLDNENKLAVVVIKSISWQENSTLNIIPFYVGDIKPICFLEISLETKLIRKYVTIFKYAPLCFV